MFTTSLFHSFLLATLVAAGCGKEAANVVTPTPNPPASNRRQVAVANSAALRAALLNARPGDDIVLAAGNYAGRFVVAPGLDGNAAMPITLSGPRNAVLDGGSVQTGYVFLLQASHWQLKGFTLQNGLKGLMVDGVRNCVLDSLLVQQIGEEGIHLRKFSSANTIRQCSVQNVGLKTPDYGEGIYLGSAKSNWDTYTNGLPDRCDSNVVEMNRLGPGITAECIDVKEGTTGGIIRNNQFNSAGITGANSGDSWMDVKGNNYRIEGNVGFNPQGTVLRDGFQVNVAFPGWGNNNEFRSNQCAVNGPGYGINIRLTSSQGTATGNKVFSSNTATGAALGLTNISTTP